jgi:hypothetical protein
VNAAARDLHIQAGSPARNVGVNLTASFTNDVDGDPRPPTGGWDIGADQHVTGVALPAPVLLGVDPLGN